MKVLLTSAIVLGVVTTFGTTQPTQAATDPYQGYSYQGQVTPVGYYRHHRGYYYGPAGGYYYGPAGGYYYAPAPQPYYYYNGPEIQLGPVGIDLF